MPRGLEKQLWFIVYEHQQGIDIFPVHSAQQLTHDQVVQVIQRHMDYDPRQNNHWIEVQGPCVPDIV